MTAADTSNPTTPATPTPPLPAGARLLQATGQWLHPAVGLIVAPDQPPDGEHIRSFLEFADTKSLDLSNIWAVVDASDVMIASALAIPSPGRTVMLFVSQATDVRTRQCAAAAVERASRSPGQADLAQALVEPHDKKQVQVFLAGDFSRLATLSYLECPLPGRPTCPAPDWPEGITIEGWRTGQEQRFCQALEASYEATLDCPGLCGLRRTEDVLVGHRETGLFIPELWTLVCHHDKPAGVLLFSPIPERETIELVYIGLSPAIRRMGLGRALMRHAMRQLAGRDAKTISLAVDEVNEPALAMYREFGFARVGRRIALTRDVRKFS
ncbi:MAG: GNAT family N-acetyltransferase [Phycisphaerales bacterium]|nr:GNAT family N-acetyltransferase [Phycisphaerales bacterium]